MTQLGTMSNDLSKGIRSEINDKNSVLSIESLNAYVHNEFFYPKADNLITGISRKTKCSTFAKHFVPKSHLLTQFKM